MTFWIFPPESEPAATFVSGLRMSNSVRRASAFRSISLSLRNERAENCASSASFRMKFSFMEKEGTIPSVLRSSGMYPIPASITARGERFASSCPKRRISPPSTFRRPLIASASSRCPLPETPASPTISPAQTERSSPSTARKPRSLLTLSPRISRAGLPSHVGASFLGR
ncbi:MAG: hypothetical protein BWY99_02844 [Synergistetes bacterium ADurb.BinA166]|nr:MAG: hypothetical protein BWY99_02844 [Synergistetes bacterium ADurb.BinA166]